MMTDPPAHTLRTATVDDDRVLLQWITSAAELRRFTGGVLAWPLDLDQLRALDTLRGRISHTLIATGAPSEALGRVDVVVDGELARLARVILAPACRGRGLSRVLVSLALADAAQRGATRVGLNVLAGNDPAERTYRRLGFRRDLDAPARDGVVALIRGLPA